MKYILFSIVMLAILLDRSLRLPVKPHPQNSTLQYSELLSIKLRHPATDLAWNTTSTQLALVSYETLQVWNTVDGTLRHNIESDFLIFAESVSWHPSGTKVATTGNRMIVWNIINEQNLNVLPFPENETNSGVVAWNLQGDRLAFTHWDNNAGHNITRIGNDSTQKFDDIGLPGSSSINSIVWSTDGTKLAIADYDSAKIWNVFTGKLIVELKQANYIRQLAWSPNGKMIAGANACYGACETQKTFQIWNADDGQLLTTVEIHTSDVLSISWNPNSDMIASGSADNSIKIWDINTEKVLVTINEHTDIVTKVAWSPDGMKIASASEDKTVRVWQLESRSLPTQDASLDPIVGGF
jgi:WD40 repeat protein